MLYFRNEAGDVFAYETDEDRQKFGSTTLSRMTDEEIGNHFSPALPTFSESLAVLNQEYQSDLEKFNKAFMTAYLADGPEQESKQLTIRAQYFARRSQYVADVAALRAQFETTA